MHIAIYSTSSYFCEEGKSVSVSTIIFTLSRFRIKSPVIRSVRGSTDRGRRHAPSVGGGLQEP
jgi:hypothetical protein